MKAEAALSFYYNPMSAAPMVTPETKDSRLTLP